jgi:hypothetical protein
VLPLRSPSFSILLLKQKDLAEAFGSGTMCGNVSPHAWSPPNFPHSEDKTKEWARILATTAAVVSSRERFSFRLRATALMRLI